MSASSPILVTQALEGIHLDVHNHFMSTSFMDRTYIGTRFVMNHINEFLRLRSLNPSS